MPYDAGKLCEGHCEVVVKWGWNLETNGGGFGHLQEGVAAGMAEA